MFYFGTAIKHMKEGKKVQREGWNGKGMYIYLTHFEENEDKSTTFQPCLVMKTAQGQFQPGWLASQPDMLSEDWQLVE